MTFLVEQEGLISGHATSPSCAFTRLRVMIATVSDDAIKCWPLDDHDPQLPPDCDGKIWFPLVGITEWIEDYS